MRDNEMNDNKVLRYVAAGNAAKDRTEKLEQALKAILCALELQFLDGRPPGSYSYSGNVTDASAFARRLLNVIDPIAPSEEDRATTKVKVAPAPSGTVATESPTTMRDVEQQVMLHLHEAAAAGKVDDALQWSNIYSTLIH